jgi:hypothetical protein
VGWSGKDWLPCALRPTQKTLGRGDSLPFVCLGPFSLVLLSYSSHFLSLVAQPNELSLEGMLENQEEKDDGINQSIVQKE